MAAHSSRWVGGWMGAGGGWIGGLTGCYPSLPHSPPPPPQTHDVVSAIIPRPLAGMQYTTPYKPPFPSFLPAHSHTHRPNEVVLPSRTFTLSGDSGALNAVREGLSGQEEEGGSGASSPTGSSQDSSLADEIINGSFMAGGGGGGSGSGMTRRPGGIDFDVNTLLDLTNRMVS